jgi:hypothetical protein
VRIKKVRADSDRALVGSSRHCQLPSSRLAPSSYRPLRSQQKFSASAFTPATTEGVGSVRPSIHSYCQLVLAKHSKFPRIMAPMSHAMGDVSWRHPCTVFFFHLSPSHTLLVFWGVGVGSGSGGSLVVLLRTPETQPNSNSVAPMSVPPFAALSNYCHGRLLLSFSVSDGLPQRQRFKVTL